ncbi:unnamed protein product [Lactuca virosa]|uniref:Spt5 KOW domain-containing protein n=1 Tax=Lactuca virosa TaxID=75947 RepID=A0AAU9P5F3_9ASTR|nr:unnamed protein product [Lactuca virosa]
MEIGDPSPLSVCFSFEYVFEDKEGFSVGQSLRIRVGHLKGYMCRVMEIRYSDITIKLDSQHKILTVKVEHLAEVKGKIFGVSIGYSGFNFPLKDGWMEERHLNLEVVVEGGILEAKLLKGVLGHLFLQQAHRFNQNPILQILFGSTDNDVSKEDGGGYAWGAAAASEKKEVGGGWGASSSGAKTENSDDYFQPSVGKTS